MCVFHLLIRKRGIWKLYFNGINKQTWFKICIVWFTLHNVCWRARLYSLTFARYVYDFSEVSRYMYTCVVYKCADIHESMSTCVFTYMWNLEADVRSLPSLLSILSFEPGLLSILSFEPGSLPHPSAHWLLQDSTWAAFPNTGVTDGHQHASLSHGVRGSELQSSCLCDRPFADLDISPVPVLLCFVIRINTFLPWELLLLNNSPTLFWVCTRF